MPYSNLTLSFGPLFGPPRLKMADFEVVFGTLETGYLQEKKFVGGFR